MSSRRRARSRESSHTMAFSANIRPTVRSIYTHLSSSSLNGSLFCPLELVSSRSPFSLGRSLHTSAVLLGPKKKGGKGGGGDSGGGSSSKAPTDPGALHLYNIFAGHPDHEIKPDDWYGSDTIGLVYILSYIFTDTGCTIRLRKECV